MTLVSLTLCALLAAAPAAPPSDHGDLAWFEGDFAAALEQAESSGQLIFLDFWADW